MVGWPLEPRKVRIWNIESLELYQTRAGAGGYAQSRGYLPDKERSRGIMNEIVFNYAFFLTSSGAALGRRMPLRLRSKPSYVKRGG